MANEVAEDDPLAALAMAHVESMKKLSEKDRSLVQDTSDLQMGSIRKGSAVRAQLVDAVLERLGIKSSESTNLLPE